MTARQFANTCPDCNRWACVCDTQCPDCGAWGEGACLCIQREDGPPPAYDFRHRDSITNGREALLEAAPARTGPPPASTRDRLAKLRAEYVAHLASLGRPV